MNFGPPDWLPWGTYVANKYRREGRSATLSHDALLIALVTAAPDVQRRLQREAKVGTPPDCHLVGSCCQRQTKRWQRQRQFMSFQVRVLHYKIYYYVLGTVCVGLEVCGA